MSKYTINICQVSLNNNIPLISENFANFKKIYRDIKVFILCPKKELNDFKKNFPFKEIEIIDEEEILSFNEFEKIFEKLSKNINYKDLFKKRLRWYYQQILKISFAVNFTQKNNENLIIWDADTIILKKIEFFKNNKSIKYGNFFEFHKAYYISNENILNTLPDYYISFLNQFIAISKIESDFLIKNFLNYNPLKKELASEISEHILSSIFTKHQIYNGSLFSEYELIGMSNYIFSKQKQRPLLFLRFGLDGKLTKLQKFISIILDYKHVTYEHSHPSDKNKGMLGRAQKWTGFLRILIKNFFKFYLRYFKHIVKYHFNIKNEH
tara:strand:+ start:101 stop:1072 length:972 start_codon:yes stop_codon:yes gene_type:complete